MNWINVLILAVVEGLTEFLPVSSTGHMIVVSKLIQLEHTPFLSNFEIVIQVGAILAVLSKYWQVLFKNKVYWRLIIASFIPTSIIGFVGYKLVKEVFLGNTSIVALGLFLGGIALVLIDRISLKNRSIIQLTIKQAGLIGLIQSLSIIPGVSRSASTIIGGQLVGLSRKDAVEYSFLLGMPVLGAAAGYDLLKSGVNFSQDQVGYIAVGIIVAFIVARWTVDWLIRFVEKYPLAVFGWYRIVLALIIFTSQLVLDR